MESNNCSTWRKTPVILGLLCLFVLSAPAQKTTVDFARYPNGAVLKMDIYQPAIEVTMDEATPKPVVIFAFGGGFLTGTRDDARSLPYFEFLTSRGYAVAAIDYRLGLKDLKKPPSLFNPKPFLNAISIAVEDVYAATTYLLQHANELNIDTSKIILSGSSAGAITVLQSDYEKRNNFKKAKVLPPSFQYAGVIAFAGAIFSKEGKPDYKIAPAPTLFFHGAKDNLVPYNKISFLGIGMFGPKSIAKKRKKEGYPYNFYSYEDTGHDVARFYTKQEYLQAVDDFIQQSVLRKSPLYIETNIKDPNHKNRMTLTVQAAMRNLR